MLLTLITAGLAQQPPAKPEMGGDITGMYSFVHEGEFVQIEVDEGKVTGLVSRFKNEDMDKAEFVDQYFEQASLEDSTLTFRTKPSPDHGVWFEFSGRVERGPAKSPSDEGYWIVKGTLTEHEDGKVPGTVHELTLKSFPEDAELDVLPRTEAKGMDDKK